VDVEDNTKVLSGAEFKLTSEADGKEYTLVTDAEGKAKVSQLALGEYTLVETKAPEGYVLDETPKTIEVKKDEATKNTVQVMVENKLKPGEVTPEPKPSVDKKQPGKKEPSKKGSSNQNNQGLPKTGEMTSSTGIVMLGSLLLIGFTMMFASKTRRKD
ncbi:MAG: SpaA isopeptide-forming pilin-related protein, partial [Vagococcus sp.]